MIIQTDFVTTRNKSDDMLRLLQCDATSVSHVGSVKLYTLLLFYPAESFLGSKIINSSFLNLDTVLTFVFHHLKSFCNHQNKNSLMLVTMWRKIRCVTCSEHNFALNLLCWIIAWEKNEFLLCPEIIHCFNFFFNVSLIIWFDFVTTREKKVKCYACYRVTQQRFTQTLSSKDDIALPGWELCITHHWIKKQWYSIMDQFVYTT